MGKGENAGDQHFLLFPQCFFSYPKKNSVFKYIYYIICNAFFLDQSKKLFSKELKKSNFKAFSDDELTLYYTIPTFDDPKYENFLKHCGKRRECLLQAFSSFPQCFLHCPKQI